MTHIIDKRAVVASAIRRAKDVKSRIPKREIERAAYDVFLHKYGKGAVGEFVDYLKNPTGYWTVERIHAEALKYDTRWAFDRGSKGAYQAAQRLKIMKQVCSHMKPVLQSWNAESIAAEALKYDTRKAFERGSKGAYKAAQRLRIVDEVCAHMKPVLQYHTAESIAAEALKYETRAAFKTGSKGAYQAAKRLGIYEQVCAHMPKYAKRTERKQ